MCLEQRAQVVSFSQKVPGVLMNLAIKIQITKRQMEGVV